MEPIQLKKLSVSSLWCERNLLNYFFSYEIVYRGTYSPLWTFSALLCFALLYRCLIEMHYSKVLPWFISKLVLNWLQTSEVLWLCYETPNKFFFFGFHNESVCKGMFTIGVKWGGSIAMTQWETQIKSWHWMVFSVALSKIIMYFPPLIINHQIWTGIALD